MAGNGRVGETGDARDERAGANGAWREEALKVLSAAGASTAQVSGAWFVPPGPRRCGAAAAFLVAVVVAAGVGRRACKARARGHACTPPIANPSRENTKAG